MIRSDRPVFWQVWSRNLYHRYLFWIDADWWSYWLGHAIGVESTDQKIIFVILEEVVTLWVLYPYQEWYCLAYYQCWLRDKWVFYGLVCNLLKITTRFGISGSRHGRKLKLSPMKNIYRRSLLVMSSLGSRHKCEFYRLENKPIVSVTEEETFAKMILYICLDVKYTIHADHVTSNYFTDWSVNYWKWLPPVISGPRHEMTLRLSPKYPLDKKWLLIMPLAGSRDKSLL